MAPGMGALLVGLLLVAFNLRASIAAVSPVLPEIRADLGLSAVAAGLLTTLPVLCFAVLAPAAAWFGRRVGLDRAILIACLVIAIGTILRVLGGPATLLAVTVLVGAAMTVGNVLGPVVIKRDFAARAGVATGAFTALLILGAGAAAAWPVWTFVGGVAQGAGIALPLTLIVLRARDSVAANGLSAMTQLVGYLIGAGGPLAAGLLYEVAGSWFTPTAVIAGLSVAMGVAGAIAGRPVTVGAERP